MHLHSPICFYRMVLSLVQGPLELRSQDNMVSMVMRLRAGRSGVGFQAGEGIYLYSRNAQTGFWGPTQPPIQWVMRDFFPGIESVQPEADYLPPCSAEANSEWSCSSTPLIQLYVLGCTTLTYFTCTWFGYNSSSSVL
jgi:hypothetical protein